MPAIDITVNRSSEALAALVQRILEARREAISRELCAIPPPIPGCDVNFNRLLEERAQVIDELQRLRRVQLDGCPRAALREICRASACLDQAAKTRVDELLGRDDAG